MHDERVGPYRIERLLGSGGMGTVYEAWDERLQRSVAIKCIHVAKELSPDRRQRLLREARSAAALTHRRIAQVYDVVEHEGRDYIVMELVQGTSLATRIATGQLPVADALDIGRQIAEGLEAAHDRGIVHRDLKADNVLIDARGQVKILDFGLAKSTDPEHREETLTEEGVVMGTSRAMSPEQASGRPVDTRSDLFSLGSLLYEMLTGTHPFQGFSPLETMHRVVRHHPAPVRKLRPEIPVEVELLVESLLEKDPRRRPESTGDVAKALAGLAAVHGTETLDAASVSRVTSRARRRRLLRRSRWAAMAAIVLAIAATAGAWWWLQRPKPPLVVAVPRVEIVAENPTEDARLLADAVRITLLNNVAATRSLLAVDPHEIDAVHGSPAEIARAVAADEVVAVTASPSGLTAHLELRRLRGADGSLVRTVALDLPTDSLGLAVDTVAAQFGSLFPRHRPDPDVVLSHADHPEDLRRFLEAEHLLDTSPPGIDKDAILAELRSVRTSSPKLLDCYTAEVSCARSLYRTIRDARHLEQATNAVAAGLRVAPNDARILKASFQLAAATDDLAGERRAIEALEKVSPSDPELLAENARLAEAEDRFDDAMRYHQARVQLRPSWQAFVAFGQFEMRRGDMAAAERLLNRALEIDPDNTFALSSLTEPLTYQDPERAIPFLERLVKLTNAPGDFTNLGMADMLVGRYRTALTALEAARALQPTNTQAVLNLADIHDLLGEPDQADELYRQVLDTLARDQHPRRDELLQKAYCLAQLGRASDAVAVLDQAMSMTTGNDPASELHFQAALVLALVGEPHSAVLHAEKAVAAGLSPIWFRFPWFDPLRNDPGFEALLRSSKRSDPTTPH